MDPVCPYFGRCGGCSIQTLAYKEQLLLKRRHLVQSLARIGGIGDAESIVQSAVPSARTIHYRGKVELAVSREQGSPAIGFAGRASPFERYHRPVIPVASCALFSPVLETVIPWLRAVVSCMPRRGRGNGLPEHVVVREGKGTGQVMVVLKGKGLPPPDLTAFGRGREGLPRNITSLYWASPKGDTLLAGLPHIEERFDGLALRLYPHTFFQPNPETALLLYERLRNELSLMGQERILGLYCGAGTIEIYLAQWAREVTGIDVVKANITAARRNCAANGIRNCTFVAMRAEETVKGKGVDSWDIVIVDPPRAGMSRNALSAVLASGAERLAYVSCDPASLARDVRLLMEGGYSILRTVPFDFFPHTSHVESLTLLRRS